ncbi:BTAD domain-containing putative transcriptional regulator [Catenulispora sp. GAS73]|uniref:BTAD domain-containing putative transcriptional regulator n=1 Tax=Catenulispora sp. GAS73 TaxID=3156269 RepID=UPI0035157F89
MRPGELDVDDFAQGCADGLRAVRELQWAAASQHLTRALALWQGEPLADLPMLTEFENRVQQLRYDRLLAYEGRFEAELQLGRHREAGKDLAWLVAENPLHEPFRRLLMLALYRSGRQVEALDAYRTLRRTLMDELGVEPSSEIRELYQQILVNDPQSDSAPPQAGPGPIGQLPADIADFTGRERETAEIVRALTAADASPGRVPLVTVTGGGGLGKTTLAVHAAHQAAGGFPDGQLYADLRGADPVPREPGDVLASFLSVFGIPVGDLPNDVDERATRFRTALGGRRMLIVLDNACDPGQIRPLIPAAAGCAVLVTSRTRLSGLAGAHRVNLELLHAEDATRMLETLIGTDRALAESAAVAAVVDSCGGLPLALRIAGARLADRPRWSVAGFAERLADRTRRLNELAVSDLAVRASFELSYTALLARKDTAAAVRGRDADEVFRTATLVPATSFGAPEVAALLARPEADVEDALQHLVDVDLLAEHEEGRYRYHDLIRSYASELLEGAAASEERNRALRRLTCWYAACVEASSRMIGYSPDRLPIAEDEPGTPAVASLPDSDAAVAWCSRHYEAVSGAIDAAVACGRPDLAPRIAVHLMRYALTDVSRDWGGCLERALKAAHETRDIRAEAWVRHRLGVFHGLWKRPTECISMFESALALHRAADDRLGEVLVLGNLVSGYSVSGQPVLTVAYGHEALARITASPELGVQPMQVLSAMGDAYRELRRYEQAVEHYLRAEALFPPGDLSYNHAGVLNNLGEAYLGLGRFDEAVAAVEQSLEISRRSNIRHLQAESLHTLGVVFAHFDHPHRARDSWKQALEVFEEIGFAPGVERVRADLARLGG